MQKNLTSWLFQMAAEDLHLVLSVHFYLPIFTKMPSLPQHSSSTPSLSAPTSRTRDDNVSSVGPSPFSSSGSFSPSPGHKAQQPQQQSQAKQRPTGRPTVAQLWKWELGSAMLLLISLAAIPATLYPHDGQPLPQWPFSISINTLLSIYSMALKACLGFLVTSCIGQLQWTWYLKARPLKDIVLFHEAANGILGSMQWLWVNRLRQPLTALGALITVVAISIDPFIQQLIQPGDCSMTLPKDTPVSVPRTNYLQQAITGSLEPAILAGLYTFQDLTDFNCSTGNCTFQNTYSSLGFCSQCSDRSSEVVIDEDCSVVSFEDGNPIGTFNQEPCNVLHPESDQSEELDSYNLTTTWPPFSVNFYHYAWNNSPEVFSVQTEEQYTRIDDWNQVTQGFRFGAILGYTDSAISRRDPAVGSVSLSDCDDPTTNDTWRCRGYGAAECILQPCVRTYSSSIEAGRINETVVDQSNLDQHWGYGTAPSPLGDQSFGTSFYSLLDLECVTDADRGNLAEIGYDVDGGGRWISYNMTFDPSNNTINDVNGSAAFPESLLAGDCLYIIEHPFIDNLWQQVLSRLIVGSVTRKFDAGRRFYNFNGSEQLLHLYNSGNVSMTSVDEKFANFAQALTLWVRANGDKTYSRRAEGDVLHYAVCLRVTWAWIALPAALTGFTLIMLALTMVTTARRAVPVWKLFPLAVLLRGPAGDTWVDNDLLAADTSKAAEKSAWDDGSVDDMSRLASRVSVQLLEHDGKYEIRQVRARSNKDRH